MLTTLRSESAHRDKVLLEISDLHVDFPMREGIVRAASGVSFNIHEAESLGVVGESGCGKSVTAQAILRIIPRPGKIVRGNILLSQESGGATQATDITALKANGPEMARIRRNEISLIMQEPMSSLSPVYTIGNQIIEKIRLSSPFSKQEAREQAIELLQLVGIPKASQRIDTYTFELSGGMRQRAMIAMALASNPRLLIADEPTTAVDVTIQAQILRLLRRLQDELGMAILLITHDLGVVANVAHRVAVMYRGIVVEQGPICVIFQEARHPYTRGLLASIPDLADKPGEKISIIPGVVPHPYAVLPGCQFHPRCSEFMPGVCNNEAPAEIELTPGHTVRCHLYQGKE